MADGHVVVNVMHSAGLSTVEAHSQSNFLGPRPLVPTKILKEIIRLPRGP
jgi:hypothetical protein